MKNTTYITLGTLILIPFIFILLFLVPEKELSDVFNLTKKSDRKLKRVHNVVFDGRIVLLDSATVQSLYPTQPAMAAALIILRKY